MDFENRYNNISYRHEDKSIEDKNEQFCQKDCCIKRVETYYCYPSYYNEEKKDDCKKEEKHPEYYEGTFKLYPSYCDKKHDDKSDLKDDGNKKCEKENNVENNKCNCRNRCNFCCGLFGRRF